MTGRSQTPTRSRRVVYRYLVTRSSLDTVPVGTVLVDKRRDAVKTWVVFQASTGNLVSFDGERRERCCPECHDLGLVRAWWHEGAHGEDAPQHPTSDDARTPPDAS